MSNVSVPERVSGAENGAERDEKLVSGTLKKERSGNVAQSGRSGNGNEAVSGSKRNWWSVEQHFSPLPLRSHALVCAAVLSSSL
jgi:hypothetical protein